MDTPRRIVDILDGSLDDLFAESKMRIANTDLITLQNEYDKLAAEANDLRTENANLNCKIANLEAEINRLHLALAHKEETIAFYKEINTLQTKLIELQKNAYPTK